MKYSAKITTIYSGSETEIKETEVLLQTETGVNSKRR